MKVIINSAENIAAMAAQQYVSLLKRKPNAILGGATGSTPLGLYAELVRLNKAGEISFKEASSFNLDEYVGLDGAHDQSYRYFMDHNLFDHIDIDKSRTRVPSGIDISDPAAYDKEIQAAGGVDLQLLGIGNNGHIGFNEPGTPFGSLTHIVELTESTREANKRFFASIDEVPTHAVTMGIKTVHPHGHRACQGAHYEGDAPGARHREGARLRAAAPSGCDRLHGLRSGQAAVRSKIWANISEQTVFAARSTRY